MKTQPKRWKISVLTWIAIYPTLTILFGLFGDIFNRINPMPLRTLAITLIVVPFMVFLLMPFLFKKLSKWLES
ncbi:hypothetical protein [Chryseolinea soli]|uniref:Uncharacterized protein n=1 Tax=Chryseolinea soli TaxID=2321403 RepID=A0A385SQU8_9BACT|nr:hypothetical protein [Chryseolinea soli]AYB31900.1 hypothetical protein D4L85_15595 [Chryseolinea soli]